MIFGTGWNDDMPQSVNIAGVWKETKELYVPVDSLPRRVFSGHINDEGVWKIFHIQHYEDNAIIDFAMNRAWPKL